MEELELDLNGYQSLPGHYVPGGQMPDQRCARIAEAEYVVSPP
jgi:hypothetical protein